MILEFFYFYNYRFPLMKSFQDWLDCQLYTSHLKNLTKIKEQSIFLKTSSSNRRFLRTANICRNISFLETTQNKTQAKSRQHNIKMQIKQNQIMQQNLNLASRLINVSSVISKEKQIQSYRKYQSLFKKSASNRRFDSIRTKKLKKFMKVSEQNYMVGLHKGIIKIRFLSIPRIPEGQSPTVWVQIYSGTEKLNSLHYNAQNILMTEIKLPIKKKLDRNLILLLHCSRGLNYINLGQYYFESPKKGSVCQYRDLVSHQDPRKHISIMVQVQEILQSHQKYNSLHLR